MKMGYTFSATANFEPGEKIDMEAYNAFIYFCKGLSAQGKMSWDRYTKQERDLLQEDRWNTVIMGVFVSVPIHNNQEEATNIINEVIEYWFPALIKGLPKEEEIEVPF